MQIESRIMHNILNMRANMMRFWIARKGKEEPLVMRGPACLEAWEEVGGRVQSFANKLQTQNATLQHCSLEGWWHSL